tara:strand:+ start:2202 stop:3326 length:1125 start_codon:yes stop_codon:yes gene_type:complete
MAENQTGQERTEEATPKKREDSRKKGDIPRSRELTTTMILFGAVAGFAMNADHFFSGLRDVLTRNFSLSRSDIFDPMHTYYASIDAGLTALTALTPVFIIITVIALIAPAAVGGWSFDPAASVPKFSKLDPIKGLSKVFGMRGIVEMLKSLAKFVLILGFALFALYLRFDDVNRLGLNGAAPALAESAGLIVYIFIFSAGATLLIAAIDVPYQIWEYGRKLKMTRQELKDESKQQDGSPEMRSRIRSLQQELANRRMMEEVPRADVIVTNPTHYAVALRFDSATMAAPRVVAKGADEVAIRIREVASNSGVPILSAPPLARSIFHTTKLNREIPAGLYVAVAQVLAYVFQLRRNDRKVGSASFDDLPIPPDLKY